MTKDPNVIIKWIMGIYQVKGDINNPEFPLFPISY